MNAQVLRALRLDQVSSHAVFMCLLHTASRPGAVAALPCQVLALGMPAVLLPAAALADPTVSVIVLGKIEATGYRTAIAHATGSRATDDLATADLVVALEGDDSALPECISHMNGGTTLSPDSAARLSIGCRRVATTATAGIPVRVRGAGHAPARSLVLDGVSMGVLCALAQVNRTFPVGIDVWFVDERGNMAALPRCAQIAVQER
jgi:alpha-D-ribose 1-methylphosphonate 5-triphosphate synthase subunit PhnH